MIDRVRGLYGMVDLGRAAAGARALASALLDGGATILQVRMKEAGARELLAVVEELLPIARARGAALIVNDRLDVALAAGADGVHLGQDDLPLAAARAIADGARRPFLIGVSTHDEAQARAAADGGADYLGFGPVFPTVTKANPDPVVGVARLARVCATVGKPIVAIGGIALDRACEVARAGAAAAALIAAVNRAPDVAAAARSVTEAFAAT